MRISDWSSDVCSSDLGDAGGAVGGAMDGHALEVVECQRRSQLRESFGLQPCAGADAVGVDAAEAGAEAAQQGVAPLQQQDVARSEEHTSELQSLMRISYAVFCLKKKKRADTWTHNH